MSADSAEPVPSSPAACSLSSTEPVAATAPPRTIRWVELVLLLAVAFGGSLYGAVAVFVSGQLQRGGLSARWASGILHELTALGLCAYLLYKQDRSFRDLGLRFRWFDPLLGLGIMVLGLLANCLVVLTLGFTGHYPAADRAHHAAVISQMVGPHMLWGVVIFTVVNAFFEELIVRAYLLTDLALLTGSTVLAVVVSAVFQGAYHLYQGWQTVLGVTTAFLVFSGFYVRLRRITPVILAHLFWDLLMVLGYVYWGPPRAG